MYIYWIYCITNNMGERTSMFRWCEVQREIVHGYIQGDMFNRKMGCNGCCNRSIVSLFNLPSWDITNKCSTYEIWVYELRYIPSDGETMGKWSSTIKFTGTLFPNKPILGIGHPFSPNSVPLGVLNAFLRCPPWCWMVCPPSRGSCLPLSPIVPLLGSLCWLAGPP
jgi:hypothetical protein